MVKGEQVVKDRSTLSTNQWNYYNHVTWCVRFLFGTDKAMVGRGDGECRTSGLVNIRVHMKSSETCTMCHVAVNRIPGE